MWKLLAKQNTLKQRLGQTLDKFLSGRSMDSKQVIDIIIPILVDQAFIIFMSLVNTAMISSAGVAAVSAVSMVDSLNIFLVNVFIAIATGGTVIVAQYKGIGNTKMLSKTATQAISAVTITSVLLGLMIAIFHVPILNLLFGSAEADVFANAKLYLIGSCISYPLMGIYQAVNGALRGVGDTKPSLHLSIMMNLTNTLLNVLFILVFNMGILGLILSVTLSRLLGTVASILYLMKYNKSIIFRLKDTLSLDFTILRKVMYIGVPFAAEQLFFNGGKLLTQTFIVQLGTYALTANAIGNSIVILFQIGPVSLSIAVVTVVGQCIGRRDIDDAKKFIKSFIILAGILSIITSLILLPFFPLLMDMFSAPEEIVTTLLILSILSAITTPLFWSTSFILPSALRAAGDSNFTSIVALICMWLIRVVLGYVLGITFGLGIIGVWLAMYIEWVFRSVIFAWRLKGEKWYAHKLV